MIRQIRNNVFETNSSSTHSIVISKHSDYTLPKGASFRMDDFGWEKTTADKEDYLFTAIKLHPNCDYYMEQLTRILEENNIVYSFKEYKREFDYYIDHYEPDFVTWIFETDDRVLRYLFHKDSAVYTGNDNSCWDEDEELGIGKYHDQYLAYHEPDKENFEYYYKGN